MEHIYYNYRGVDLTLKMYIRFHRLQSMVDKSPRMVHSPICLKHPSSAIIFYTDTSHGPSISEHQYPLTHQCHKRTTYTSQVHSSVTSHHPIIYNTYISRSMHKRQHIQGVIHGAIYRQHKQATSMVSTRSLQHGPTTRAAQTSPRTPHTGTTTLHRNQLNQLYMYIKRSRYVV